MARPQRYLVRMSLFLVAVLALIAVLFSRILEAFEANPLLNGLIAAVLLFGVIFIIRQVLLLFPEQNWLAHYRHHQASPEGTEPRLLAPMARMLEKRSERQQMSLSTLSMRSLLDSLASRLDEGREMSRYLIGLLIFLGLLGTFWGLLSTVASVASVIGSLSVEGDSSVGTMFSTLQQGLEKPLEGMATAFSSSLFGLAGSLVLGFLELQAGQAQNRFYNEVEDWLSEISKLSTASLGDGEGSGVAESAYMTALMEQTAENLDSLQRIMRDQEQANRQVGTSLTHLSERLGSLNDHLRAQQNLMIRVAESQQELKPIMSRMSDAMERGSLGIDEASRQHIRNMDVYLARMLDESSSGRQRAVDEIRSELKLMSKTIALSSEHKGRD